MEGRKDGYIIFYSKQREKFYNLIFLKVDKLQGLHATRRIMRIWKQTVKWLPILEWAGNNVKITSHQESWEILFWWLAIND